MKNLTLLMLFIFWGVSKLQAQSPYWSFPPNYVNFNTGGGVSVLGAGTKAKNGVSNAIFSQNGNLLFYAAGTYSNATYYFNPSDAVTSVQNQLGAGDLAFIPRPGKCNTYLIPSFDVVVSQNPICTQFSPANLIIPTSKLTRFNEVSFSDNLGHLCKNGILYNDISSAFSFGMAAPVTPDITSSTKKPYLYIVKVVPVYNQIQNFCTWLSNDVYVDIFYGQSNLIDNRISFKIANVAAGTVNVREADLSFDGKKLAFSLSGSNLIYLINNVDACVNGNCNTSNLTSVTVSTATAVNGVEFSPDGTKLFYTKSTSSNTSNQIGYVDLGSMAQSDVAGSANIGNSFIEYAIDGYMYVSDGSNLKGFNLSSPFTVSKTISNVVNSTYNGVYTLPDQIDGSNNMCQAGPVSYSVNPLPSSSKVNGLITASGSASVPSGANVVFTSNSSVVLKPNFFAKSGSAFRANIATCNGSIACIANGCTSSTFRKGELSDDNLSSIAGESAVHPNPITLGSLSFGRTVNSYTLMNSSGVVMKQGVNTDRLDIIDLPKGLYMLDLDGKTQKLIVQ